MRLHKTVAIAVEITLGQRPLLAPMVSDLLTSSGPLKAMVQDNPVANRLGAEASGAHVPNAKTG